MTTFFNARAMVVKHCLTLIVSAMALAPTIASAQDEVIYYHTDAVGTVRMTTDASGAILARYDYLPFGETWPTTPPNTSPDVRQFTGKERDAETGLDYFGARYYRSSSGRFISVDPALDIAKALQDPQLWNRYSYARNNPTKYVDPDGREIWLSAAHQRALSDAGRRAAPAAAVGVAAAAIAGLVEAGPVVWRAAVACFLSPSCQSGALDILEEVAGGAPTSLNRAALLDDAVATGRAGLSKAGRALQSHAERRGWLAGKAIGGNAAENTKAARGILEMVLEHGQTTYANHATFGNVIKIRLPDGSGAWWKENGEFIGFLAPYTPKR